MIAYNVKKSLKKAVDYLKSLNFKPEDTMVTGSIALDLHGLFLKRPMHDVDFIIKMDEQTWRHLKLLDTIESDDEERLKSSSDKGRETVFLNYDDIKINIWKYDDDKYDWSNIKEEDTGVYVATVDHIIHAKKMYGRNKDYKDINEIVKSLL